jgi:hypothetical protein
MRGVVRFVGWGEEWNMRLTCALYFYDAGDDEVGVHGDSACDTVSAFAKRRKE